MASRVPRRSSLEEIDVLVSGHFTSSTQDNRPGTGVLTHRRRVDNVPLGYVTHRGSVRRAFHGASFLAPRMTRLGKSGWRHDYSLYLFHKTGRFRKDVKRFVKSRVFRLFMVFIVILNAVSLCVYTPSIHGDIRARNQITAYVSTIFVVAYTVEATMKIIAYGLILDAKAYLRKVENIVDAILIVFGIIYISLSGADEFTGEFFAAFMALKLMKILTAFRSVNLIVLALAKSLVPLFFLGILTLCVMFFFTLVGMELFSGGLHGGCYANYTVPAGKIERFRVSDFPCNRITSHAHLGSHECPGNSDCKEWHVGPNFGITSFDNFGKGLLTVFQLFTLEGWSGVFYLYESAYGYQWPWLYFTIVIALGSIFILNLLLGVLTSVFLGVSERQEARGELRRLKETKKYEEDIINYRDWMQRAAELDVVSESGSIGRRNSLFFGRTWLENDKLSDRDEEEEEEKEKEKEEEEGMPGSSRMEGESRSATPMPSTATCGYHFRRWERKVRRRVRKAVKSLAFFWVILAVLATNLILLMTIHYPAQSSYNQAIYTLNYIFTGVYIMEVLLKLYGLGLRKYFTSSHFNIADFVFTVLNILDLVIFIHINVITDIVRLSVVINACRSVTLVRVFKYTRYWKAMKEIISAVFQLTALTISLMALIGLFLFFFTVLGFRIFGDSSSIDSFVTPNFDDLFSSFLVVFQLMTTEDWHNVLYRSVNPWVNTVNGTVEAGHLVSLYFVVAVIVGGFILISVFLAIAVDKLSEVRSLEEHSVEEHEKMKEERKVREERIHALKDTSEPQVHRRTLRRVLTFYSNVPSRAVQPGGPRKQGWQHQLSLPKDPRSDGSRPDPAQMSVERSLSVPSASTSSYDGSEPQEAHVRFTRPKLQNPLRLVARQPSFFDRQARYTRGEGRKKRAASASTAVKYRRPPTVGTDTSSRTTGPTSRPRSVGDSDVFVFTDKDLPHAYPLKKLASSPDGLKLPDDSLVNVARPYERTQSFPGQSPGVSTTEETPKLETVDEGGEEESTESLKHSPVSSDAQLSAHPLPPQPSAQDVSRRLRRQSSLEILQPLQSSELESRPQSQLTVTEARVRIKDEVWKVWSWVKDYFGTFQLDPNEELKEIPNHSSFFILSPDNRLRQFCYSLVCSRTFQTITYAAVFLSSALLALEMPIAPSDTDEDDPLCIVQNTIVFAESLFLAYFLLEMLFKMVALGCFLHRGSYFRGFFNVVDFIVTVTTLIPLVVYLGAITRGKEPTPCRAYSYDTQLLPVYLATLRTIRVLRPVRVFRFTRLYVVVNGLLSSLRKIGSILFLDILVLVIFAVIGTEIFRGRFRYCTDPVKTTEEECKGYFFTYPSADLSCPKTEERVWKNGELHFDNIGNALLTLFAMLTGEGWQSVMYSGINSVPLKDGEPQGPEIDHSPVASLYFLFYMFIMTFVLLNLFQAFVIVTFQEVGLKTIREAKLDRNQRNCIYYSLTVRPSRRFVPKFKVHRKLNSVVSHPLFKVIVVAALVLNCIVLASQVNDQPMVAVDTIYWLNFVFTVFFAVEALLKIIAFTPVNYFQSIWNSYEFVIALGSILEVILQLTIENSANEEFQYSHIASSFRVLRLLRFIPQIRLILWTVIKSLEIFPWVGVLQIIVILSFAVVGMQLFGTIEPVSIDDSDVSEITVYSNFGNFPQALLVMLRVSTGENWPDVMVSCTSGRPCYTNDTSECGNDFTYVFFPVFYFISSILILNLFVAIIIDNFDYVVRDKSILGAHQLSLLVKLWSIHDPEATGKLTAFEVMDLLQRCNPPVGWGKLCPQTLAYRRMMKLNMPLVDGKVSFNATIFALVRVGLNIRCEGCVNCLEQCNKDLKVKLKALFPNVPQEKLDEVLPVNTVLVTVHSVREEFAARLIQQIWRRYVVRRKRTIELFQGSRRRVLKAGLRRLPDAGPDLSVRALSDFELDLPPSPTRKRAIDVSPETTNVIFEIPASHDGSEYELAAQTPSQTNVSPLRLPARLQTIEETPERISPFSDEGRLRTLGSPTAALEEGTRGQGSGEADDRSELSFTSAQSSPGGSEEQLPVAVELDGYHSVKETLV